jgi:hypothetical protein
MKRKRGLRSITLFLSISVSVFSACLCVLLMANEYYTARNKLDIYTNEYQGWEACRQTEPTYYNANAEAVRSCHENLEEAKDNYWVTLPKNKLIGLFVVAGLGSAIGGYLAVWSVWFGWLGIYRFVRWIKHFFQGNSLHIRSNPIKDALKKLEKEKDNPHEFEEIEEYDTEKPVEGKERIREEELEHQVELLRDEVCSVRAAIEKLSTIEICKADSPKDGKLKERKTWNLKRR